MHIERWGDGPRAYFGLHGWSGDYRTFSPLRPFLPASVTFYSADLPGCGTSPLPRAWTIGAIANEIAETITQLDRPVTLVGNCSGANIAFFVARRIPTRITRIVTIDAFAYWPWYFSVFVNPVFGRYAYFSTFENPIGRWITNLSLSRKRTAHTSLTDGFTRVNHQVTYRYLTMLRDGGGVEQFARLQIPIVITYGQNSFAGVEQSSRIFHRMWPHARVVPLAGAGHLPLMEATQQLQEVIFSSNPDLTGIKENLCPESTTCAS